MDMHLNCNKIFEANSPYTYFDFFDNNIVITTKNFIAEYQIIQNKVTKRWALDNPNYFSSHGRFNNGKNQYVVIENKHIIKCWTNMDKDINLYGKSLCLRDLCLHEIYFILTLGMYIITQRGNILPYAMVENKLNHGKDLFKEDGNIIVLASFKCIIKNIDQLVKHYIVLLCQDVKDEFYITINALSKNNSKCVKKLWLDPKFKLQNANFDILGHYDHSHNREEIILTIGFGSTLISINLLTLEDNSKITMEDFKTKILHPFLKEKGIITYNQIVVIKRLDYSNIVLAYRQQDNPQNGSINIKNYHVALYNIKLGLFLYDIETNIKETMTRLFAVKNLVFMATTNAVYMLKTDKLHRSQSLNKLIGVSKYHGEQHRDNSSGSGKIARKQLGNKIKLNGFIPSLNKNASKYMMMEASDELFRNTINFLDPSYKIKHFAKNLGDILCAIENDDVKGFEESFENFKRSIIQESHRLVPEYAANFCTLYKCVVQKILTWPSTWPSEQIAFLIQRSLIPACFYELLIEKILHQNDFQTVDIAFASLRDALNEKCIIKCLLHILDHPQEVPEKIALSLMRNIIGYRGNCTHMAKILKYLTLEHSYRLMEYLLSLFTTAILFKPSDQAATKSLVQPTPSDTSAIAPKQAVYQSTDSIGNIIYWLTCILEAFYNQIINYHNKSLPFLKDILTRVHNVLDIIEMSHLLKSRLSDVAEKIHQTQLQSSKRKFEDSSGAYLDTSSPLPASNYSIEILYF